MTQQQTRYVSGRVEQDVLVLTISVSKIQGEEVADAIRLEMLHELESTGLRSVVVDFQHAQYVSSTAFRPLLALRRRLHELGGGRVVLCGLSSVVGDVFYTTRMVDPTGSVTALFDMEADVPAAVARLTGPPPPRG